MNKKGMELSINFTILLILSLVVFGYSVQFVYQIYGGLSELQQMSFDKLDSSVQTLNCGRDPVCPTIIRAGQVQRKDLKVYSFQVVNTLKNPATFQVQMNQEISPENGKELYYTYRPANPRTFQLSPGEKQTIGIGIEIPKDAVTGNYVFNIRVNYKDNAFFLPYGTESVYKLYLEVI